MIRTLFARTILPAGLPLILMLIQILADPSFANQVRVKDIATFQDRQELDLIGYGLVIGLDGTGDGNGTQFTSQSVANMMQRMGVTVDPVKLKVKNIAAVLVTAKLSSNQAAGSQFDVTVSSIGDASSLQGGQLIMTPVSSADGTVHGIAQGAVSIGGFNVQVDEGNKIVNNYTLVGRVPNGGKVTAPVPSDPATRKEILITLANPDMTTADRITERINVNYGTTAYALDAGTIKLVVPDSVLESGLRSRFLSDVGQITVTPDAIARVVINERTGTIVAGQNVTIEPVAVAHGTITVNVQTTPLVSQPESFGQGQTTVVQESQITVTDQQARVVELEASVKLADIASALNKIGATPRDIIAIFQALKQAGALRAELVIM